MAPKEQYKNTYYSICVCVIPLCVSRWYMIRFLEQQHCWQQFAISTTIVVRMGETGCETIVGATL